MLYGGLPLCDLLLCPLFRVSSFFPSCPFVPATDLCDFVFAGIGPVLGLVSVPLLGSASDQWRGRYGRRRPFIWALSLGVLLSLFLIPRAGWLAGLLCPDTRPLELALLILGVGLLDFCGQVCFTPLEALLSDLFRDPDHCRQAFSVYAFMISLGGCLGYLLPAIDWDTSALAPYLGTQEECLFGLLTLIFLICMAATLFVAEEAVLGPPEPAEGLLVPSMSRRCCPCHVGLAFRNLGTLFPRLHQLCCRMPRTLRRLFVAELCSWMALMTFTLFYTDFVGEGLYQGVPRAEPGTEARRHYDEGESSASVEAAVGGYPAEDRPGLGDAHSLGLAWRLYPGSQPHVSQGKKGSIDAQRLMNTAAILVVSIGLLGLCGSSSTGPCAPCLLSRNSRCLLVQAVHRTVLEPVWGPFCGPHPPPPLHTSSLFLSASSSALHQQPLATFTNYNLDVSFGQMGRGPGSRCP